MSFCVKCGLEYDDKLDHNFCARCGCDLRKTNTAGTGNTERDVVLPSHQAVEPPRAGKPIVGIIVGLVIGIVGLLWTCAVFFQSVYGNPSNIQIALNQAFPGLQIKSVIGLSFAILGYTVLIVGSLMAQQNHPKGAKVVRVTAYSMIAVSLLSVVATFFAVMGADAWQTLNATTKGSLIGGLVGGAIGALLQWGFLLILFRNQSQPNQKIIYTTADNSSSVPNPYSPRYELSVFEKARLKSVVHFESGTTHKCPKCSCEFKLESRVVKGDFTTCPNCHGAFSPSDSTFVATRT